MVREFHTVIGKEVREQILAAEGRLPDLLIACVGGGSNSIGLFHDFLNDAGVKMVGVEAGGDGTELGRHAARFSGGSPGVLHGTYTYILQDLMGQVSTTHSISAGLDYAGVGPEHAMLHDSGRVEYVPCSDQDALNACVKLLRLEGILPALESSHAIAEVIRRAPAAKGQVYVVNLSGRGDKDIEILERELKL
jgi:tryptophan synthase beta chain